MAIAGCSTSPTRAGIAMTKARIRRRASQTPPGDRRSALADQPHEVGPTAWFAFREFYAPRSGRVNRHGVLRQ